MGWAGQDTEVEPFLVLNFLVSQKYFYMMGTSNVLETPI